MGKYFKEDNNQRVSKASSVDTRSLVESMIRMSDTGERALANEAKQIAKELTPAAKEIKKRGLVEGLKSLMSRGYFNTKGIPEENIPKNKLTVKPNEAVKSRGNLAKTFSRESFFRSKTLKGVVSAVGLLPAFRKMGITINALEKAVPLIANNSKIKPILDKTHPIRLINDKGEITQRDMSFRDIMNRMNDKYELEIPGYTVEIPDTSSNNIVADMQALDRYANLRIAAAAGSLAAATTIVLAALTGVAELATFKDADKATSKGVAQPAQTQPPVRTTDPSGAAKLNTLNKNP